MSISNKTYVAQQETLVEVRDKIGNTDDTGGSYNSGTVNGKINTAILGISGVNNGIEGLNNRLDGVVTPYGKGTYGDLIVGTDFAWPSQDGFNRYVIHTKSMTIPEGVTLKPPEKCDGLYILSQGDVTINGVIDVRGMRKTFDADLQLAPTINVGSQEFVLAKGGYSPKGGTNGRGSQLNVNSGTAQAACPALSLENSISGNINGGGVGQYAIGGPSEVFNSENSSRQPYTVLKNTISPSVTYNYSAPGAIVIIAKGEVIINGKIKADATEGKGPTGGWLNGLYYGGNHYFSVSGTGAIPPSGGGAVTIVCNSFIVDGQINTNGTKHIFPDGADYRSQKCTDGYYFSSNNAENGYIGNRLGEDTVAGSITRNNKIKGSEGGKGGTFISTAGEIKVYTGVSE